MLLDDIYVMWIPIVVIVLMAALGWWRGAYRELMLSASIVLSALVAVQWATQDRWALDLSNTFSGLNAGQWQFFLTLVLMGLIVAVVGYGLGGLFARRPLSSTSRTLGALLGLANGAALSGWVLRAAYEGLANRQDTSTVYQNPVSLSLMVWAGWFPVALAVIGAVAALVYSLTGDKAVPVTDVSSTSADVSQPSMRDMYARPVQPIYQPIVIPPAQARVDHYMPPLADPQSSIYAPSREQTAMAPTVANSVPAFNPPPVQSPERHEALPIRAQPGDSTPGVASPAVTAPAAVPPFPASAPPSSLVPHTPPFGYDLAALWGQDDADSSSPGTPSGSPEASAPVQTVPVEEVSSTVERRCRICGNPLQPGTVFCTECGTRASDAV